MMEIVSKGEMSVSLVELTVADGRKKSLPKLSALLIEELTSESELVQKFPDAKTYILYSIEGGTGHVVVRDAFKQVCRLFPQASGGVEWADFDKADGKALSIKHDCIQGWEQTEADDETRFTVFYRVRIEGMNQNEVRSTFDDIRKITNTETEKDDGDGNEQASKRGRRSSVGE